MDVQKKASGVAETQEAVTMGPVVEFDLEELKRRRKKIYNDIKLVLETNEASVSDAMFVGQWLLQEFMTKADMYRDAARIRDIEKYPDIFIPDTRHCEENRLDI